MWPSLYSSTWRQSVFRNLTSACILPRDVSLYIRTWRQTVFFHVTSVCNPEPDVSPLFLHVTSVYSLPDGFSSQIVLNRLLFWRQINSKYVFQGPSTSHHFWRNNIHRFHILRLVGRRAATVWYITVIDRILVFACRLRLDQLLPVADCCIWTLRMYEGGCCCWCRNLDIQC